MFPLSYDKLVNFIVRTYEDTYEDVPTTALEFSPNINAIALMMQTLYEYLTDTQMKGRFTRITRKLLQPELGEGYTSDEKTDGIDSENMDMEMEDLASQGSLNST